MTDAPRRVPMTVGPASSASARLWAAASRRSLDAIRGRPDLGVPADVVLRFENYLEEWVPMMDGEVFAWTGEVDPDELRHLAAHWARLVNLARDDEETDLAPADPGGQEFYDALATGLVLALAAADEDEAELFAPKFEEVVPEFDDVRTSAPVGRRRVVLVDDHPDIRMLVRIGLEAHGGFEILSEASDGEEAVRAVSDARGCPDAVLLDLTMPVMDGMTALPLILDQCPETHVVVFSADDSVANRDRAQALGAVGFLRKDAGVADIAAALSER
ncbi:MAG TPA: response regulator transcription factor [Acidimicrobiales bacterium]|nr:response regulator transcription factor [Acidimicrobiales bacterium]